MVHTEIYTGTSARGMNQHEQATHMNVCMLCSYMCVYMAAILKMHMRTPTEVLQNARSFARVSQGEYSGEYVTRELASIYTCIYSYVL